MLTCKITLPDSPYPVIFGHMYSIGNLQLEDIVSPPNTLFVATLPCKPCHFMAHSEITTRGPLNLIFTCSFPVAYTTQINRLQFKKIYYYLIILYKLSVKVTQLLVHSY